MGDSKQTDWNPTNINAPGQRAPYYGDPEHGVEILKNYGLNSNYPNLTSNQNNNLAIGAVIPQNGNTSDQANNQPQSSQKNSNNQIQTGQQQTGQSGQNSNQNNNQVQSQGYQQQTGQPSQQSTVQSYNPNKNMGSGYTNIQRIVQANQGNNLGKTVGQGIQQAGQQVSGQLGQAQNQFQQQTGQNQVNTDANNQLSQSVLDNPDQYVDASGAQQTANGVKGNQFSQLLSGVYKGPQTLGNIQQLQGQAADVTQMNKALGSAGGRMGLLSRFVGNPQYNSGQQTLDSLLLGKSQGQDLSNARLATAGLGQKVSGAEQGAEAQAGLQTGAAQAFGNQLRDQFGNKISGMDTARDTNYKQLLQDLQSGKLSQSEAANLGLTNGQEITSNMLGNIGNYVNENPLKASAQNIASTQDYARLNALRQLGGQNISKDTQGILGQYADQDKNAGAFNAAGAVNPDLAGFTSANQAQLKNYHNIYDPAKQGTDTANAVLTLVNQRNAIAAQNPFMIPQLNPQVMAIQNQIRQLSPGAVNSNGWTEGDWAQSNATTQGKKYQDAMNTLNSQYGALRNLQINPDQQVAQTDTGPQSVGNLTDNTNAFNVK